MDQTIISTFVQLGAFAVLAYLVIRWQRDDLAESRKQLEEVTKRYEAAVKGTTDQLLLVAQTLGQLCGKIDDIGRTNSQGGKTNG